MALALLAHKDGPLQCLSLLKCLPCNLGISDVLKTGCRLLGCCLGVQRELTTAWIPAANVLRAAGPWSLQEIRSSLAESHPKRQLPLRELPMDARPWPQVQHRQ